MQTQFQTSSIFHEIAQQTVGCVAIHTRASLYKGWNQNWSRLLDEGISNESPNQINFARLYIFVLLFAGLCGTANSKNPFKNYFAHN